MSALSISKAWEETSEFLAREFRLVAPVVLALIAIPAAVDMFVDPASEGRAFGLISLILMIVSMAGQMAVAQLAIGWSGSIGEAIAKAFRRLGSVIGAGVAVYGPLIVLAIILLAVSLGAEGMANFGTMSPEEIVKVSGVVPTILLVAVVALFLSVRFLPMIGVAMAEDADLATIIRRSWALTRGKFGKLFVVIILLAIASLMLTTAVTSVVGALVALAIGPVEAMSLSALVTGLLTGLATALVAAVYSALIGRIYVQLAAPVSAAPAA